MTIQNLLAEGKKLLQIPSGAALIDTPSLDAALLLAETLRLSREDLIMRGNEPIAEEDRENFFKLLERRRNGECIAYILGRKEFRGLEFAVNPGVLVPRPDTETLVEAALEYIDSASARGRATLSLLDLCTGSGAVAISLKSERPFLTVTGSDISQKALDTAALNAKPSVRFIHSDLFKNINGTFDIIVSNPPYIPSGKIAALAPEVQREPIIALDGGADGLELIRKIISRAPEHLCLDGVLLLEADAGQMPDICPLLESNGFCDIRIYKDLAGRERVIAGTKGAQRA